MKDNQKHLTLSTELRLNKAWTKDKPFLLLLLYLRNPLLLYQKKFVSIVLLSNTKTKVNFQDAVMIILVKLNIYVVTLHVNAYAEIVRLAETYVHCTNKRNIEGYVKLLMFVIPVLALVVVLTFDGLI